MLTWIPRPVILALIASTLGFAETPGADHLVVTNPSARVSMKGPDAWFTGSVRVDMLFQPNALARTSAATVTFEPGARTAWHTHPLGQTLIVTSGKGWVQECGGQRRDIHPGDVVWIPPGVKHWHGATAAMAVVHIAVQDSLNTRNVEWMEKVSEDQYGK